MFYRANDSERNLIFSVGGMLPDRLLFTDR